MDASLSDRGAGGAARWMRLPNAINGKAKHRDAAGQPFRVRVVVWNPDISYSVDVLVERLGLELTVGQSSLAVIAGSPRLPATASLIGSDVWTPAPDENPVLAALKERGLYKHEVSPGVHEITCPWVKEHTDEIDHGSAYFPPSADHPRGGFSCRHSHGDKYRIKELLDFSAWILLVRLADALASTCCRVR